MYRYAPAPMSARMMTPAMMRGVLSPAPVAGGAVARGVMVTAGAAVPRKGSVAVAGATVASREDAVVPGTGALVTGSANVSVSSTVAVGDTPVSVTAAVVVVTTVVAAAGSRTSISCTETLCAEQAW